MNGVKIHIKIEVLTLMEKSGKTNGVKIEVKIEVLILRKKIRENEQSQNSSQNRSIEFEKKSGKTKEESNFDFSQIFSLRVQNHKFDLNFDSFRFPRFFSSKSKTST